MWSSCSFLNIAAAQNLLASLESLRPKQKKVWQSIQIATRFYSCYRDASLVTFITVFPALGDQSPGLLISITLVHFKITHQLHEAEHCTQQQNKDASSIFVKIGQSSVIVVDTSWHSIRQWRYLQKVLEVVLFPRSRQDLHRVTTGQVRVHKINCNRDENDQRLRPLLLTMIQWLHETQLSAKNGQFAWMCL